MSPTILQRAVVDEEFRQALHDDPSMFDMVTGPLPVAVEPLDDQLRDFWTESANALQMCVYTCSFGWTYVCESYTKW